MYEAVRARPAGQSTVARFAATAADYGYDGVVVTNPADQPAEYDRGAIREAYGIDVVAGLELSPDTPAEAAGAVGHHRPAVTMLCLRGGDPELNAYAVRQSKLDVLATPMAGDGDLDHVQVRAAADHRVRVAVDLGPVLRTTGGERTAAIAGLRKLRELLMDADAPYVVTAGASSHLGLRSPRDLASVATVAGFDRAGIERGLAEWGHLANRNRERQSADHVGPGVRVDGQHERGGDGG